ncbi:hypothetical protein XELAEV_18041363mg [Xenopus laevis]|uniref:Uncharacterized protein n=1 Tax=Xenopus laevis TaxID=8355 RepID=A0A974C261_XENLA|nr:hypothetical protein XELAEV_18041363mg [Xenopus laevis]
MVRRKRAKLGEKLAGEERRGKGSLHSWKLSGNKQNIKPSPGIDLLTSIDSTIVASVRGEGSVEGGAQREREGGGGTGRRKEQQNRRSNCGKESNPAP